MVGRKTCTARVGLRCPPIHIIRRPGRCVFRGCRQAPCALRRSGMAPRGALVKRRRSHRLAADAEALMRGGTENVGETRDYIG